MATTRLFTVDDLEQSPPEGERELIDGELIPVNPTSFKFTTMAYRLGRIVGSYVDEHNFGAVTGADGGSVLFPDRETLLAPDVGFVFRDRIPSEDEQDRFPRLAPGLVVEVLSPSDRMAAAVGKISVYMEAGVQAVWLGDPLKRTITVFVEDDAPRRPGADDTITGGNVRTSFNIRVSELLG